MDYKCSSPSSQKLAIEGYCQFMYYLYYNITIFVAFGGLVVSVLAMTQSSLVQSRPGIMDF
jgi:hypothetical protein